MTAQTTFYAELHEPQHAHALVVRGWNLAKENIAAGRPMVVEFKPLEETRAIQLNKEYWGYVLKPISEQAQIEGIGAQAEGWHDYYKKMFLGYRFVKVRVPGRKRPLVRRELRSTTDLTNRDMREYMEQVRAHAATIFGVRFPAMERDTAPHKKASAKRGMVIDAETGEITEDA